MFIDKVKENLYCKSFKDRNEKKKSNIGNKAGCEREHVLVRGGKEFSKPCEKLHARKNANSSIKISYKDPLDRIFYVMT